MGYIEAKEAELVPGLTIAQKLVLIGLCNRANWETQGGTTFYGQGTLAAELGMSRKSVTRSMKYLEEQGFIDRSARYRQDTMSQATRSSDLIRVNRERVFLKANEHREALEAERFSGGNPSESVDNRGSEEPFGEVSESDNALESKELGDIESLSLGHNVSQLGTNSPLAWDRMSQLNKEPNKEPNRELNQVVSRSPTGDPHHAPRKQALHIIQEIASSENRYDTERFDEWLTEHYGQEVSDYFGDKWGEIPSYCHNRYEAGAWLNKFLNTAQAHEGLIDTANEEEERAKQLARLEQYMTAENPFNSQGAGLTEPPLRNFKQGAA